MGTTVYAVIDNILHVGSLHDDGHVTCCGVTDTTAYTWHESRYAAWWYAYDDAQKRLFAASEEFHRLCGENMLLADALLKEKLKECLTQS